MDNLEQVAIQREEPKQSTAQHQKTRVASAQIFLRKIVLAALTMLGIGYILVNATLAYLIGYSVSTIPIVSQANIAAIAGRILFIIASIVSALLGGLFIYGAVQFYEKRPTKGIVLLGALLGSFYLMSLGVGSVLLLSQTNVNALMLIVAPILVAISATTYASFRTRIKLAGSIVGCAGGAILAYATFNFQILDQIFPWSIPFTGPFMSFTVLESAVMILAPVAACVNSFSDDQSEERPLAHLSILLLALTYGIGCFIGSLILSMSFWNLIWQSPWLGPLHGLAEWALSAIVFWSASLVLVDIAGILLIIGACLGFFCVSHEFAQL